MGSSASKTNAKKGGKTGSLRKQVISPEKESRLRSKVRAMIEFNRHIGKFNPPPFKSRGDVYDFVQSQKEDNSKLWQQLETADSGEGQEDKFRLRPKVVDQPVEINTDIPSQPHWQLRLPYGKCDWCNNMAASSGHSCRICDRMFHKECLDETGKYLRGELDMFLEQSHTYVGWSCFNCDNITHLLSEEEMREVMDSFEKYGAREGSEGSIITWNDFITLHKAESVKKQGKELTRGEEEGFKQKFRLIDMDDNGYITYYEYMTQEACLKLAVRNKDDLVAILTKKELGGARSQFEALDTDKDGVVSEQDMKAAFRSWYGSLRQNDPDHDAIVAKHVENQTAIMFDEEARRKGVLTWDQYIRSQALYIISSRPNRHTSANYVMK